MTSQVCLSFDVTGWDFAELEQRTLVGVFLPCCFWPGYVCCLYYTFAVGVSCPADVCTRVGGSRWRRANQLEKSGPPNHKYIILIKSKLDHLVNNFTSKLWCRHVVQWPTFLQAFENLKVLDGFGLNYFLCAHPHYDFCQAACETGLVRGTF